MTPFHLLGLTASVVAISVAAPATAETSQARKNFNIPAQAVKSAMPLFARQSGVQILFPYDQVEGLRTKAITGSMTPQSALKKMIAGTGLNINITSANSIALSVPASTQRNMPAKPVQIASLGNSNMAPIMVATGLQGSAPSVARAGAAAANEPAADIIVTGSRGQPRTVTDSPTPIDVIGAAEMDRTGKAGVLSALNTLVPSFNLPTRAGGGTSTVIATGGLRGLNPDQALILVNGKRRHKTSLINAVSTFYNGSVPADMDMIPSSAISHIEVLRDGAAAQYGSDAIAGVINIILKDKAQGGSASFSAGQNFDRSDGELYRAELNLGTSIGDRGYFNVSASAKKQEASNRAEPISSSIRLYPLVGGQPDPREATVDRLVTYNYGSMPQKSINLGYNAEYDLGGDLELYSFGTYSQRKSDLNYTFRAPNNANSLPQIFPNGFRPRVMIAEEDLEFAVGLRATIAGWDADLSTTYGSNRARQRADGTLNATMGPTSPTEFYVGTLKSKEIVTSLDLTRGYDVGGGNLQVSGGLQHRYERYAVLQGDEPSYYAGTYTSPLGLLTPGASGAAGFTPADAGSMNRNNFAVYGDVAWDPNKDVTLGAAVRYENYDDDSGDTLIGKFNARYAATSWLSLRGAVSTGFRAPALAQQVYASTTGQFRNIGNPPVLTLLQIKTLPVGSAAAIALGAEPLTPEKSTNLSAGFVLTPLNGLNITVDAYQIKVKDRITLTSTLTGTAVSNILIANGLSGDISAQYYTNAIDTRTRGIDVVATYRHNVGDDISMNWNLGYNYNKSVITNIKDNPSELASLGADYVLFDRLSQSNMTVNLPRTKLYLGNSTTWQDVSLNTRVVRYGAFKSYGNSTSTDREFGAKWITDVELSWKATELFSIAIGANNLFNVYPERNDAMANVNTGAGFYATSGAYGFTGGFYYGRITVNF
ncbi:MAG: TonB-dependent receptor [Sphingobium sp.]|nr:TonB-dependent receptor [Sphingobium sp.]